MDATKKYLDYQGLEYYNNLLRKEFNLHTSGNLINESLFDKASSNSEYKSWASMGRNVVIPGQSIPDWERDADASRAGSRVDSTMGPCFYRELVYNNSQIYYTMEGTYSLILKPSTWYTLSWYEKLIKNSSNTGASVIVMMNTIDVNVKGKVDLEDYTFTSQHCEIGFNQNTNGWVRHSITFKTKSSISDTSVEFRLSPGNSSTSNPLEVYRTRVQLEEGKILSPWKLSQNDMVEKDRKWISDRTELVTKGNIRIGYVPTNIDGGDSPGDDGNNQGGKKIYFGDSDLVYIGESGTSDTNTLALYGSNGINLNSDDDVNLNASNNINLNPNDGVVQINNQPIASAAFKTAGAANGVATLDNSGKVPTSQLPSIPSSLVPSLSDYLPLTGGTLTGTLGFKNTTTNLVTTVAQSDLKTSNTVNTPVQSGTLALREDVSKGVNLLEETSFPYIRKASTDDPNKSSWGSMVYMLGKNGYFYEQDVHPDNVQIQNDEYMGRCLYIKNPYTTNDIHYYQIASTPIWNIVGINNFANVKRVKPSTWYTLSFWTKSGTNSVGKTNIEFHYGGSADSTSGKYIDGVFDKNHTQASTSFIESDTEWHRHTISFKTISDAEWDYDRGYYFIEIRGFANDAYSDSTPGELWLTKIQLEEGTIATDWKPNVRDIVKEDELAEMLLGGRNLIKNSTFSVWENGFPVGYNTTKASTIQQLTTGLPAGFTSGIKLTSSSGYDAGIFVTTTTMEGRFPEIGKTYTISFYAKNLGNERARLASPGNNPYLEVGDDWTRIVEHRTFTNQNNIDIYVMTANSQVGITGYMIEEGSALTSWKPAPEDFVTAQVLSTYTLLSTHGALATTVGQHTNNSTVHVTAAEKAEWSGKQNQLDIEAEVRGGQDASLVSTGEKYTWNHKQDKLTIATSVSSGNTNPVTSGAVYTAIHNYTPTPDFSSGGFVLPVKILTYTSYTITKNDVIIITTNSNNSKQILTLPPSPTIGQTYMIRIGNSGSVELKSPSGYYLTQNGVMTSTTTSYTWSSGLPVMAVYTGSFRWQIFRAENAT